MERRNPVPHYPHETIHKVKDLPIHFNTYEEQGMFIPNHWHNSLEIVYIDYGHMEAQVNGMKYHLYDHQFILINSGDIHSTVCIECSRVFLLQIPRPFLLSAIPDYDHIRFEMTKLTDSVRERLKAIMVEMEKPFPPRWTGIPFTSNPCFMRCFFI